MADPLGPAANHVLILFGATGDLAKRKLLPGLFHPAVAGLMPERYQIVGSGRPGGARDTEGFRSHGREAVAQFGRGELTEERWASFADNLSVAAAPPSSRTRSCTPWPAPSKNSVAVYSGWSTWPCRPTPSGQW